MVRRPTWILLVILALVVGAYTLMKSQSSIGNKETPSQISTIYLITQADGVLQKLRIVDNKGNNFQMQRDLSKTWVITSPKSGVADQGLAGAAEAQVAALRVVTILENPPDASTIGLGDPADTMDLEFINGTKHTIEVGYITPTNSGYYIRFDKSNIYIIEQSGIAALLTLLASPPYPPTETPSPTVESTSTPTTVWETPTSFV
jgi:hypothetical protein